VQSASHFLSPNSEMPLRDDKVCVCVCVCVVSGCVLVPFLWDFDVTQIWNTF
jgi:hypothetical protein